MTHRPQTFAIGAAALAVTAAFWLNGHATIAADAPADAPAGEAEHAAPVSVQTATLRQGHISETARAYGVIQPRAQQAVAVTAKFDAIVTSLHIAQGEAVEAGTPLLDINPTPEARLALKQAQDAQRAADRNLEQARQRRQDQLATNADVATAEQAQQAARTQLEAVQARGISEAATLKATTGGVVTSLTAQAGQTATAGTVLALITPANGLEAKLGIDPGIAPALAAGAEVDVRDVFSTTDPLHSKLRSLGHTIDPQTRRLDAFVTLPSTNEMLAGTFVEATFVVKSADGLIAPRDATQQDDEQWTLFTVHDGHAVRHVIKLGLSQADDVQVIADDLKADDTIITARNGELSDGAAVTIEAPATRPAEGAKGEE